MEVIMQSNTNINNKTLVVGVPEHLNQISELTVEDENIIEKLEELKRNQIINTNVGTISSTLFSLNGKKLKLITVGLGNLKTTNYSDFLKVFGNLFQYLKKDRITQASLLFDTFGSQVITIDTVAEILGQQSEQATYQFDGYKTNKMPPYQLDLDIHTESSTVHTFVKQGLIIGSSINLARDYSNIP
ncbi:MAG: M17 family peptidase N-terminal domain-containing protein, partial [Staphylococcus equorum]